MVHIIYFLDEGIKVIKDNSLGGVCEIKPISKCKPKRKNKSKPATSIFNHQPKTTNNEISLLPAKSISKQC